MKVGGVDRLIVHKAITTSTRLVLRRPTVANHYSTSTCILANRSYSLAPFSDNTTIIESLQAMKARLLLTVGLFKTASAFASGESKRSFLGVGRTSHANGIKTLPSRNSSYETHNARHASIKSSSSRSSSTANDNDYVSYYNDRHAAPHHDETTTTLTLRLARRADVPSMQQCNLATLPENYNEQFYYSHLQQWPELALVVVAQQQQQQQLNHGNHNGQVAKSSYTGARWTGGPSATTMSSEKVVAYVLGKVENRPMALEESLEHSYYNLEPQQSTRWYDGGQSSSHSRYMQQRRVHTASFGHVTSLAVLQDFRRQGLARELMMQLHAHLRLDYGHKVDKVGLHVRAGNGAATRLYQRAFGYNVVERIPGYYQDGEDGLLMEMDLKEQHEQPVLQQSSQRDSSAFLNSLWRPKNPWNGQYENETKYKVDYFAAEEPAKASLRLPRQVGLVQPQTFQQQRRPDELEEPMQLRY
ncbi:hypothetical protein MPSEU_000979200 [Mayamaea pseudoterrestris]|nr:hypothetical protein MPSEU_000979200 [Mayamaea pseudoterrestris]